MGRKPGCRKIDTGGGRQKNLFGEKNLTARRWETENTEICLVPPVYSLDLGRNRPAVWKVTQDLPADMTLEKHKWFLLKFTWTWAEPVWSQLLCAELKVKSHDGIPCVLTWMPVRLGQYAWWDCVQVILFLHREGFLFVNCHVLVVLVVENRPGA